MRARTALFVVIAGLAALAGLIYSGFSTADFVAHLDRQLHPLNCSFLPGVEEASQLDESATGCKVALFSAYSSFWRDRYWGGIPWSLFAVGLFAFALALALWGLITRRGHGVVTSTYLVLAGVIAVAASAVFFSLAARELGTFCTLCVGTYVSSGALLFGAVAAAVSAVSDRRQARQRPDDDDDDLRDEDAPPRGAPPAPSWALGLAFFALLGLEMGAAALLPPYVYARTLPDYSPHVLGCGELEDPRGGDHLLTLGAGGGVPGVLVLDPLCPACKEFHVRMHDTGYAERFSTRIQLLPLDAECNWMIKDSMHPGACLVSRALLCAGSRFEETLAFVYEQQERFRLAGLGKQVDAIHRALVDEFPDLAACIDDNKTKIRLNKVLRNAVDIRLPLLTPQLYLNGRRLCDEDTDLGLDFAMPRLLGTVEEARPTAPPARRGLSRGVIPSVRTTTEGGAR